MKILLEKIVFKGSQFDDSTVFTKREEFVPISFDQQIQYKDKAGLHSFNSCVYDSERGIYVLSSVKEVIDKDEYFKKLIESGWKKS